MMTRETYERATEIISEIEAVKSILHTISTLSRYPEVTLVIKRNSELQLSISGEDIPYLLEHEKKKYEETLSKLEKELSEL